MEVSSEVVLLRPNHSFTKTHILFYSMISHNLEVFYGPRNHFSGSSKAVRAPRNQISLHTIPKTFSTITADWIVKRYSI